MNGHRALALAALCNIRFGAHVKIEFYWLQSF